MCSYNMDGSISFSTNRLKSCLGWSSKAYDFLVGLEMVTLGEDALTNSFISDAKANPLGLAEMTPKSPVP